MLIVDKIGARFLMEKSNKYQEGGGRKKKEKKKEKKEEEMYYYKKKRDKKLPSQILFCLEKREKIGSSVWCFFFFF